MDYTPIKEDKNPSKILQELGSTEIDSGNKLSKQTFQKACIHTYFWLRQNEQIDGEVVNTSLNRK